MLRTTTTLLLALAATPALADEVAYTCDARSSAAVRVEPLTERGACVGARLTPQAGGPGTTVSGFEGSGTILASPDGRSVVFVQTWPYAELQPDGRVVAIDRGGDTRGDALGVVVVRDGDVVARHTVMDLVSRPYLVSVSTSHVRWLASRAPLPALQGDALVLETTSGRRVRIDVTTGAITDARDAEAWTGCAVLAYGELHATADGGRMEPSWGLKGGTGTAPIRFRATEPVEPGWTTVCLQDSPDGFALAGRRDGLLLNGATFGYGEP
jgi:hypothetical protein